MTREDFVRHWRARLAGLALCGLVSELRDDPMKRGSRALEIPAEVDRLLGQLFDSATGEPKPTAAAPTRVAPKNGTNGTTGLGHQRFGG